MKRTSTAGWGVWAVGLMCLLSARPGLADSPAILFGDLYARVQTERLFADSKTFADAVPQKSPDAILADYRAKAPKSKAQLAAFVRERFVVPPEPAAVIVKQPVDRAPLEAHIAALWPVLTREPRTPEPNSSLLALNWPYVVPGGRFRELYYWDSYFTMLGLVRDGHTDTARYMVRNFADLIGRYGHVPNGTRTYYISRSQPPVFYLMVGLLADAKATAAAYAEFLPALRAEHAYWMRGEREVREGHAGQAAPPAPSGEAPQTPPALNAPQAFEHVVAMPDGAVLNRYWDASPTPRDESYREDVAVAAATPSRPAAELYTDLRAAAESGWDFSSRWFMDGRTLATIETTSMVPVDLNSLLFGLERAIAAGCAQAHDQPCVSEFERRARDRQQAVTRYLWDTEGHRFLDYHWKQQKLMDRPSAAMLYPLFTGLATAEQAQGVASAFTSSGLLASGGVLSTTARTGQQWDAPNGWAPHQWIAVAGLDAYGQKDLAHTVATRFVATVERAYRETGKLLEKYDVQEAAPGGGGEYPLQDGFGWTNGVTRALLERTGTPAQSQ